MHCSPMDGYINAVSFNDFLVAGINCNKLPSYL